MIAWLASAALVAGLCVLLVGAWCLFIRTACVLLGIGED